MERLRISSIKYKAVERVEMKDIMMDQATIFGLRERGKEKK